ncbi:2,3-diketo-5-methylthio-1-phosphopentane phosphatase [Cordyceps militaris CM01]|uniref:Enolase-phosphatase E1 n=1 Tax=Cordyceps militaris (strain CM01) TaxID=983644 RepID=G3JHC7_CORMM|nr:2,3-diketo-5-methylthio-1-phosphopentane phosphatase [Cordyceps militaris CM01]EGX91683.1 2,3-diketo-5-methylthio-1-phosphopentane phosphatase [Cordyceps militaris CM01]
MLANVDVVLLDIEGTVCPISFVRDVLFPYALQALSKVLDEQWDSSAFAPYREAFPEEYRNDRVALEAHVRDLVERDVKAPYLKSLQGHLWRHGYETGVLQAPLFDDVPSFIKLAHSLGKQIMIYSSGSVPAQKLFFGHTTADPPNMIPLITAWFDTVNAGPKTEAASYTRILSTVPATKPSRWLFLSDNIKEVDAARAAGLQSYPVVRPGNAPLPVDHPLTSSALSSFVST